MGRYDDFQAFRTRLNTRLLAENSGASLNTRRFFTLDSQCYKPGKLDVRTKELLGLVASMVLRCDDCIAYHVDQCLKAGVTPDELFEAFDVALIVGGSIVIPHLRRAVDFMDEATVKINPAPPVPPANT
jgi:AhpD family alkylhydroperoxidase